MLNPDLFIGSWNIRKECFYKENWRSQKQNDEGEVWSSSKSKIVSKQKIFSHPPLLHRLAYLLFNPRRKSFPPMVRCFHKTVKQYLERRGNAISNIYKMYKTKGVKYCSEPELKSGDCAHAPDRCGSRACSEGPECAGYVNIETARGGQLLCLHLVKQSFEISLARIFPFLFLKCLNINPCFIAWTFSF